MQAINTLNTVDVVFMVDKGDRKRELTDLRREICERYITRPGYRVVTAAETPRDREAAAYRAAVDDWRSRRADTYERLIADELGEDQHGAFLAWGDPAIYDSTLHVLDEVRARGAVGLRAPGHPGHQQHPGAGRPAPDQPDPDRAAAAHHHRPAAGRGLPGQRRRRGGDAGRGRRVRRHRHRRRADLLGRVRGHAPTRSWSRGTPPRPARRSRRRGRRAAQQHGWIMDSYLLRRPSNP